MQQVKTWVEELLNKNLMALTLQMYISFLFEVELVWFVENNFNQVQTYKYFRICNTVHGNECDDKHFEWRAAEGINAVYFGAITEFLLYVSMRTVMEMQQLHV